MSAILIVGLGEALFLKIAKISHILKQYANS